MKFVAYRSDATKRERLVMLDDKGKMRLYSDTGYACDGLSFDQLVMGAGTQYMHFNVYRHRAIVSGHGFNTRELADKAAGSSRILCVELLIPL